MEAIDIKIQAHEIIDKLPEGCSWEDVQYHFYVVEKIQKGLNSIEEGHILTHDAVKERLSKWLKP